jgi:hypothetical protein
LSLLSWGVLKDILVFGVGYYVIVLSWLFLGIVGVFDVVVCLGWRYVVRGFESRYILILDIRRSAKESRRIVRGVILK